jgi:DNA-binding transcriptional ArsR family regulator
MMIQDQLQISDLETLKVLSDPLRVQILEQIGIATDLGNLKTVKELAQDLEIPATKLYYHIKLLEKHHLIQVAETRVVSGIIEKHYQACARKIRMDLDVSQNTQIDRDEGLSVALAAIANLFDGAYLNVEKSLRHRRQQTAAVEETVPMLTSQASMQLLPEQADEFIARLGELVNEFESRNHPEGLSFSLTVLFNPNHHIPTTKPDPQHQPSDFQDGIDHLEHSSAKLPPPM